MYNILTLNNIAQIGLDEFNPKHYNVSGAITTPDAILLRSHNMHDMQIPPSTQLIVRAGAGTNNIPIAEMTKLGIPVLNTPGANANAVKELVISGMLLACRNVCAAWDYVNGLKGKADIKKEVEANKKNFAGFELPGKTLGVIGLGSIGVKVANAACGLDMKVIGFDPAMTVQNAWELSADVQKADQLGEVFKHSDFISIHVPLIDATKHLINAKAFSTMKKGVVVLNFARDGIIDNQALFTALNSQQVARYVCDFPEPELLEHNNIICLPHLGASTREAEENCAVMAARQIQLFLEDGTIKHSVNFPAVKLPRTEGYRISVINANVPKMVAQISSVLSDANLNIIDMINKSRDHIAYTLLDIDKPASKETLDKMAQIDGVVRVRSITSNS